MDFIINLIEGVVNWSVNFGANTERRGRHRLNKRHEVYRNEYRKAFGDKVTLDRAQGQFFLTIVMVVAAVTSFVMWIIGDDPHMKSLALLTAIGLVVAICFLQLKYYHQIQDYAIEKAEEALREKQVDDSRKKDKAAEAAANKAAQEKFEDDLKHIAEVNEAKARQKAALQREATPSEEEPEADDGQVDRLQGVSDCPF